MTIQAETLKELLAVLGETFDRKISPAKGRAYWEALKGYETETVEAAISRAIRELKFFPVPAEIIEFIEGNPRTRAEISWAGVLELLRKYGAMKSQMAVVDGATAWAVERMGGIGTLARMNVDSLRFENKRYFALFEHAERRGLHQERALLYGDKERKLFSDEFIKPQLIHQSPESIAAPPARTPVIESPERTRIAHQIQAEVKRLAAGKSL